MKYLFLIITLIFSQLISSCSKSTQSSSCDWSDSNLKGSTFKLSKIDSLEKFYTGNLDSFYIKNSQTIRFLESNSLFCENPPIESVPWFHSRWIKYYTTVSNGKNQLILEKSPSDRETIADLKFDCNSISFNATLYISNKIINSRIVYTKL